jgi:hypothetical protein
MIAPIESAFLEAQQKQQIGVITLVDYNQRLEILCTS